MVEKYPTSSKHPAAGMASVSAGYLNQIGAKMLTWQEDGEESWIYPCLYALPVMIPVLGT